MKYLFLSLSLSFSCLIFAQKEVKRPVDSKEAFENYQVFYEDESYENALDELNSIQVGDTSYIDAQIEKTLVLINLKRYDEAIEVCKEGIKNPESESDHIFRLNWAFALSSKGDTTGAIQMYEELIEDYPFYIRPQNNKAQLHLSKKQYKEYYEMYKHIARLFPFDTRGHYNLGVLAYNEGNFTECFLALNMVMLLDPGSSSSRTTLAFLNEISNNSKAEQSPKEGFELESTEFEDIDLLIKNYAALSKKYKVPGKSKIYLSKQNHLIMSQLLEKENTDYFFSSFYEPIYEKIMKEDHFEIMQIFDLVNSTNENHVQLVEKNIKKLKEFNAWFREAWYDMNKMHQVDLENLKGEKQIWYYDNGQVSTVGSLNKEGTKSVGFTKYYYPRGLLKSEGRFNEAGRDGVWKFYHLTGELSQKVNYKDGKATDTIINYNKRGVVDEKFEFNNEKRNGFFADYYMNGNVYRTGNYVDNFFNGKVDYLFKNGNNEYEAYFKEGKLDGMLIEKYANGNVYRKEFFKDNEGNGDYLLFWLDGSPRVIAKKEDDELVGKYQSFHQNGQLYEEGMFVNGLRDGEWKEYFSSGELAQQTTYSKGEFDGPVKYFDHDNIMYSDQVYKGGFLIAYKYLDKQGNVLSEGSSKKKIFPVEVYSPHGVLTSKGDYKAGIGYVGAWESYTDYGALQFKYAYEEGKLEGLTQKFYPWGQLEVEKNFKEDELDGLYTEYYGDGIIQQQGYYENGKLKGLWIENYEDGTRKSERYYFDSKLVGNTKEFATDGKLKYSEKFNEGILMGATYYDSLGNVLNSFEYENGEGVYKKLFQNKALAFEGKHIINSSEGLYTWYYPNGTVKMRGNYLADEEEGLWEWFHPNKKISKKGMYENGEMVGVWELFWDNGVKRETKPYYKNSLHGKNILYNEAGKVIQESDYVYGDKHGEQKFYDDNGVFQMGRYYNRGVLTGYYYLDKDKKKKEFKIDKGNAVVKGYFPNGKLSREFTLENGYFIGDYKTYYENGNIETSYSLKNDERDGVFKDYYPNGKIKATYNYVNGEMNGKQLEYFENGKIKEVSHYKNGIMHGNFISYASNGSVSTKAYYYDGHRYEK